MIKRLADCSLNMEALNGVVENHERIAGMTIENVRKKESDQDLTLIAKKRMEEEDAIAWHEYQLSRKAFVENKITEYVNAFTVHGLKKIFTGSKFEKVFWFLMLTGGVSLSILIVYGLILKFLKHDVYTEIRAQVTDQNVFPSLSICENTLLMDAYFSYCGVAQRYSHTHKNFSEICDHMSYKPAKKITMKRALFWSNGLFNVTKCETWGGKNCIDDRYLKSLDHFNHSCITWNYKGDIFDIYSHVDIKFHFIKPPYLKGVPVIITVPHHYEIHEIDVTKKIDIEPEKHYDIKLDKTIIKRLPFPFPSNCTSKKSGDIFPGKYTRRSCIESHNYIEMFKKCGDTLDYIKQFIPKDIIRKYKKNRTIRDILICVSKFGRGEAKKSADCAFPCEDLDLDSITSFHERYARSSSIETYHMSIQLQRVDTYQIMEEKELYSWDQMACEIGGLIGLVIGASVISLVEIMAYILLVMVNKFI